MGTHATAVGEKKTVGGIVELPSFPAKAGLGELLGVTAAALRFWPPLWVQSFLGPALGWLPPHDEHSEFTIIDRRQVARTLEFLSRLSVPSLPRRPPDVFEALFPRALNELFWRPTTIFEHPAGPAGENAFPHEHWFFINGIGTNEAVARLNAQLLTELFHRPITVIQNSTNSLVLDLGECAIGKEFKTDPDKKDCGSFTEPGLKATIAILQAIEDAEVDKVVVVAHSQGTIILANVLRAISKALATSRKGSGKANPRIRALRATIELTEEAPPAWRPLRRELAARLTAFLDRPDSEVRRLEKLEIYTFANCADKMKCIVKDGDRGLPRMEHFANERDCVARLGILSPYESDGQAIDIDGPLFKRKAQSWPGEGWGHLMNEHYLLAMRGYLQANEEEGDGENPYPPGEGCAETPRLYGYFKGRSPFL